MPSFTWIDPRDRLPDTTATVLCVWADFAGRMRYRTGSYSPAAGNWYSTDGDMRQEPFWWAEIPLIPEES